MYFIIRTLPFGWKASAFIYLNLVQLIRSPARASLVLSKALAEAAAYIVSFAAVFWMSHNAFPKETAA